MFLTFAFKKNLYCATGEELNQINWNVWATRLILITYRKIKFKIFNLIFATLCTVLKTMNLLVRLRNYGKCVNYLIVITKSRESAIVSF